MDELIALGGDVVAERKKMAECIKRLERALAGGGAPAGSIEAIYAELDRLSRGVDRLGSLARTLVERISERSLTSVSELVEDLRARSLEAAERIGRRVKVDRTGVEARIEANKCAQLKPVLFEMLELFLEYCVEPARERRLRQKREVAFLQLETKVTEHGLRLRWICDGNGVMPPLVGSHGRRLASLGVRAVFEGRSGKWSAWSFHIPVSAGEVSCTRITVGSRALYVPGWATLDIQEGAAPEARFERRTRWALSENVGRIGVEPGSEQTYGRFVVRIGAGLGEIELLVESAAKAEPAFVIPLEPAFTGGGRFLGVVNPEKRERELCLVLNPEYLVYGEANHET